MIVVARKRCAPSSAATSRPSIPRVSSWPLLALCGQQHDDAEVVASAGCAACSPGCGRSPATTGTGSRGRSAARAAQRAHVGLEDRELAAREHAVGALGDRADELDGRVAGRRERPRAARSASPAVASQRSAKCAATSRTIGPRSAARRVVPADRVLLVRVLVGVVAVAGERRSGRSRRRTRSRRRRSRASRGGSASAACRRRAGTGSSCRAPAARARP